jgi:fatty-acyl-CoA synthase
VTQAQTLTDFLALANPERLALVTPARSFTYAQFAQECQRAVGALHVLGVKQGDRVAMLCANEPELLINLFALNCLGAALLPLNFRLAPPEWVACLEDANASFLIVHDDFAQLWEQAIVPDSLRVTEWEVWTLLVTRQAATPIPSQLRPQSLALLVYTSGTTGKPKGVMHTTENLIANAKASWAAHAMQPEDHVLACLPMFHVGGLCIQTLPALLLGARVSLQKRFDPSAFLALVHAQSPTITLLVPAVMQALLEHPSWPTTDLTSLRACMTGSSIVPVALLDAFHARGLLCGQVYGSTETGPVTLVLGRDQAVSHLGSVGWPALDVQARLEPAPGQLQLVDGVGELWVNAPNVALGYWQDPGNPAFSEGWFHTGDLACQASDGSYRIVGRCKDMIISGGENIYPAEIEQQIMSMVGVLECAAIGVPDVKWGEALVVAVIPIPGMESALNLSAVHRHLNGRLARFKWPKQVVICEAFPKTALGKVRRDQLLEQIEMKVKS